MVHFFHIHLLFVDKDLLMLKLVEI